MVYGIVALTLFCASLKGYCGKRISGYTACTADAMLFNLLRMMFCIAIGLSLVLIEGAQSFLRLEWQMLLISAFSGLVNAAFLVGWLLAVQKNALVLVDVGLTLGSLLPAVLCAILYQEAILPTKMIGFALILGATVILAIGKPKSNRRSNLTGWILLILAAVGDGMTGFSQQLYKQYYTDAGTLSHGVYYPKSVFHFYTFVFAALALLLFWIGNRLLTHRKQPQGAQGAQNAQCHRTLPLAVILHLLIMAICLFASNYLQTVAVADFGMPSQVLYPIMKGGCLITVTFTAAFFFGERITRRTILGCAVALCGIVCMSLL